MAEVSAAIVPMATIRARSARLSRSTSGADHCAPNRAPIHRYLAHRARVNDEDSIRQGEYFVQIARIQHYRGTGIACSAKSCMHLGGGEHVETTSWAFHHQTHRLGRTCGRRDGALRFDLAPENQLLLVAAGKGAHGRIPGWCTHIELAHQAHCPLTQSEPWHTPPSPAGVA